MAKAVASFPKGRRVKKILHLWTNRLYCTLSSFPGLSYFQSLIVLQYTKFNTSILQAIRDGGGGNKRSREPHPTGHTVISWPQTLKDQISGRSGLYDTPLIFCCEPRPHFSHRAELIRCNDAPSVSPIERPARNKAHLGTKSVSV